MQAGFSPLRNLRIPFALIAVAVVLFGAAVITISNASSPYTFDGAPATPAAYTAPDMDIQVHSRDPDSWFQLPAIDAQHGADCGAPPATHTNTSYEGSGVA